LPHARGARRPHSVLMLSTQQRRESVQTVVVGGGQAGLAVGYHLARRGLPFVIVDANRRIGDPWRKRWNSLRLFTPARYDALPGMPFPAQAHTFPSKDQMADYLEAYAARFELPVRTDLNVDSLSRRDAGFALISGNRVLEADNVVVAMSDWQTPRLPPFAAELHADTLQVHSSEYRCPDQMRSGGVLVVGAGNSGAEIALEIARAGHRTWLSGRDTGSIPFQLEGAAARYVLLRLVLRGLFHHLLTVDSPLGRRVRPRVLGHGMPLLRVKPRDLAAAKVERVSRTVGVQEGRPMLEDGRVLDIANVVWCTGYDAGLSWIDPSLSPQRASLAERGIARSVPGLYFVGRLFLYAPSSAMIHGLSRDADRISQAIQSRMRDLAMPAITEGSTGR
jgi:putative flavoprotein involved in K+ transport